MQAACSAAASSTWLARQHLFRQATNYTSKQVPAGAVPHGTAVYNRCWQRASVHRRHQAQAGCTVQCQPRCSSCPPRLPSGLRANDSQHYGHAAKATRSGGHRHCLQGTTAAAQQQLLLPAGQALPILSN